MGIGISSFTEIVGAGPSKHFDILGHQDVRLLPRSASIRPARPSRASAPSRRARATRRPTPRSWPRSWASRPTTSRSRKATPTPRRTAWAPTPAARTPVAGAAAAMAARKIRDKARKIAAHLLEVSEDDLEWEPGKFSVKGAPEQVQDDPGDRLRRLHQPPAGDGGGPRGGRATTIRRTSPSRSAATSAWSTSTAAPAR